MARLINRLTARQVATLGDGRHSDGAGLYLDVDGTRRRWIYRHVTGGKVREIGLGGAGAPQGVTLAEARSKAEACRRFAREGKDPRDAVRSVAPPPEPRGPVTFGEVADKLIDDKSAGWRNPKHAEQWATTLGRTPYDARRVRIDRKAHSRHVAALAALRKMPVAEVDTDAVLAVLEPIWGLAPETAVRVRGRIEAVLTAATARRQRTGPNPAAWRGHLEALLSAPKKLTRGHHAAVPYAEAPAVLAALAEVKGMSALALRFAALTAARSGEVRGMTWGEVDLDGQIWVVPALRMKGGREHRVPLSAAALRILGEVLALRPDGEAARTAFVFPGVRGGALSDMSLAMALRRVRPNATPHGFRSTFRDWAGDTTNHPREVVEECLAHVVGNKVERAYRRGEAVAKRRLILDEWAQFVAPLTKL